MNEEQQPRSAIWYTRRSGQIKGPFPAGMVRRFVLLGRLRPGDEVSADQTKWYLLRDIPELIPKELRANATEEERERLMLARLREDERVGDRRGEGQGEPGSERREGTDRRGPEPSYLVTHRKSRSRQGPDEPRDSNFIPGCWLVGILTGLFVAGLYVYLMLPPSPASGPDCAKSPAPSVNWSNCNLGAILAEQAQLANARIDNANLRGATLRGAVLTESNLAYTDLGSADLSYSDLQRARLIGTNLRGADLSSARLAEADLSFADLHGANLGGADLTNAKLDRAIWMDGKTCAPGSVGICRQ